MRLVGVIDLRGGVVVHAIAGQRQTYRPLQSRLCPGADPVEVARTLAGLGVRELYVADLDALDGAEPDWEVLSRLRQFDVCLWVDAGVNSGRRAAELVRLGIDRVVVGLETWPDV